MSEGATLLRTLSLKSQLKFGPYKHNTVGDLIAMNFYSMLIRMYYECSKITYNEEVLGILHITPERRIPKPGNNKTVRFLGACLDDINANRSLPEYRLQLKTVRSTQKRSKSKIANKENFYQWKTRNRDINQSRPTK